MITDVMPVTGPGYPRYRRSRHTWTDFAGALGGGTNVISGLAMDHAVSKNILILVQSR
jgi:hypothetical protein